MSHHRLRPLTGSNQHLEGNSDELLYDGKQTARNYGYEIFVCYLFSSPTRP